MNAEKQIIKMVALVYRECDIIDVPIDCQAVIETLGYDLIPYSRLARSKRQACRKISEDAFTAGGTIYYNDTEAFYTRIRFSLMHELGHLLLGHTVDDPFREQEADTFASWMLVPRVDMELCRVMDAAEVAGRYDISLSAARCVINDYDRWRCHSRYGLFRAEEVIAEQLSIETKKARKKACEARRMIRSNVYKMDPEHSPWRQHKAIIKLEAFRPKSKTINGQLRELAQRRKHLRALSQMYGLDFDELMLEQARVDHYYKEVI